MLAAGDNPARAGAAFSHAASVRQVRIGKLLDAGPHDQIGGLLVHDEVGVLLDLALMGLAMLMNDYFWHFRFSAST